jgi:multiple sugar transport system substrate-binding protein
MAKRLRILSMLLVAVALLAGTTANTQAQGKDVTFFSTQFNNVEESAKIKTILNDFKDGTGKFVGSEEGPMIDLLKAEAKAGKGTIDVVGSLHGSFPVLAGSDLMLDLTDVLADVSKDSKLNQTYVDLGKLGTKDQQYYIPWMQATYIMAASKDALQYLPAGADINALTWDQVAEWAKTLQEKTGKAQFAMPVKGLFHRFLQGYAWPSFTGGVVTTFKSKEAADMLTFFRDKVWPYTNPESINYDFMGVRLLSGEVMLTWDHVARLKPAFDQAPDKFVAFPSPSGPKGLGYMPVLAGLGIPATAANPEGAKAFVKFMLSPATQAAVMNQLGFYPVIEGVDTKDLPAGVAAQLKAVQAQQNAKNAIPSLLPIGLGAKGGDINQIFRNAFNRVVNEKQDPAKVLEEEGASLQKLMTETGAPCWAPDPVGKEACQVK